MDKPPGAPHPNSPAVAPMGYAQLTPDVVLDALDAVGIRGDGRILQLNSYENRVFRVMCEDGSAVVVKFYRPGRWSDAQIAEEHDFAHELAQAEVPVIAPRVLQPGDGVAPEHLQLHGLHASLACWQPPHGPALRFSVSPCLAGRDPSVETDAQWQRLGRLMGRVHAVGQRRAFSHRLRWHGHLAHEAIDTLEQTQVVDDSVRARWLSLARQAADAVAQAWQACEHAAGPQGLGIRLHGDAHRGNLLERESLLYLVDLDDACTGPPTQDLWLFLDGQDRQQGQRQLDQLLRGYEEFANFDDTQRRLIEPLRTLRVLRHSAWIAQRWSDPAFALAFPGFGSPNHWADQMVVLQEQLDRMNNLSPL